MTLASESNGTQTATINTEHSLAAPTTAKTRVFLVDLVNLVSGDIVELRMKTKVLTAGTERTVYTATYQHAQTDPIVISVPVPTLFGGSFTLKQTAGTGRSFPWAVYTLD